MKRINIAIITIAAILLSACNRSEVVPTSEFEESESSANLFIAEESISESEQEKEYTPSELNSVVSENKSQSTVSVSVTEASQQNMGSFTTSESLSADSTEEEYSSDEMTEEKSEVSKLKMMIGDTEVSVDWVDNEAVTALKEMAGESPIEISMSMYGGFEQVGSLGADLPRNDLQTTTSSGDIVLYSGNQLVVFYGSNSWAYTRLGSITDQNEENMTQLLGNGDVTITITVE